MSRPEVINLKSLICIVSSMAKQSVMIKSVGIWILVVEM
ncbi:hypothetical protein ECDEC3F_4963 [Escherichia coli DEC3F]|nr:hypothetical protein ECDEC3F_4963 [Escherichia coli DEC3F]